MIKSLAERVASIRKALKETDTSGKPNPGRKNAITRLHNEIVLSEVKDILSDEGGVGFDD